MGHLNHSNRRRRHSGVRIAKMPCPKTAAPFRSDDQLLEAAAQLFRVRRALSQADQTGSYPAERLDQLRQEEGQWSRYWHRSCRVSRSSLMICQRSRRHRLNETEQEILAALILDQLAMLPGRINTSAEVLQLVTRPGKRVLHAVRTLSEHGRLHAAGLISFDDPDEDLPERKPVVDPALVDSVLAQRGQSETAWGVSSEAELFDRMQMLTRTLMRKSDTMSDLVQGCGNVGEMFKLTRKVERLLRKLDETLQRHPGWKLGEIRKQCPLPPEQTIFMALLGKRLGHLQGNEPLFTGGGLARAASDRVDCVAENLRLVMADGNLVRKGLIRPCGGDVEMASNDAGELEQTEFELTEKARRPAGDREARRQGALRRVRRARRPSGLSQLVLSDRVRKALDMAMVHARHGARLMDDWGLGELIPYGRGPVLLFSGPPGTGKTATAEALAHELGRPILVADYSRIQNCFIGQTEKNIVRAFREAKDQEAVLFWDEADAMFYDRDSAHRNWEVRDVNVLLQELERFEGVCILATNRKITLDKALQRRITLKVEFERPDPRQRRQIWEKFMPRKLPVARDLDLEELSRLDLTGGEIKNVVLNAARLALQRDERGPVTMADFREALSVEARGGWNGHNRSGIGFGQ